MYPGIKNAIRLDRFNHLIKTFENLVNPDNLHNRFHPVIIRNRTPVRIIISFHNQDDDAISNVK